MNPKFLWTLRHAILATMLANGPAIAADPAPTALELGRGLVTALDAADRPALARFLDAHLSAAALAEQSATARAEALARARPRGALKIVEASGLPQALVLNLEGDGAAGGADVVVLMSEAEPGRADEMWLFPNAETAVVSVSP